MKTFRYFGIAAFSMIVVACGGSHQKEDASKESGAADFLASQPLESGLYNAEHYTVAGPQSRKGSFDGRIIFSLSEDQSAVFVFENGNRTKINNLLMLSEPFRKDGSTFTSRDKNGQPVSVSTDSAVYALRYVAGSDTLTIKFDSKPRSVYTPFEALENIQKRAQE